MYKLFGLIFIFFMTIGSVFAGQTTLKGFVEKVPDTFFGSWRVSSYRLETDAPVSFKEKGVDLWNLSVEAGVINLSNPFSGAMAEIKVEEATANSVTFIKIGKYDNKILTDKVSITINGDNFSGTDELKLDTISDVDGSIRKTETAIYSIKGEKIAGQSVL